MLVPNVKKHIFYAESGCFSYTKHNYFLIILLQMKLIHLIASFATLIEYGQIQISATTEAMWWQKYDHEVVENTVSVFYY